jgi:GTP cyclohydrolase I
MSLNGYHHRLRVNGQDIEYPEYLRVLDDKNNDKDIEILRKPDADALDEKSKIELIERHFSEIMNILGLDLTDDSLRDTPRRVAKMFVKEIFSGLIPKNKPKVRLFKNKFRYNQMLVEKDIRVNSYCEHHFVPIIGKAHVAYISNGYVIGLSKINRIVDYYAKRPQLQERLTEQIAGELKRVLGTEDVAVIIEAAHMCVSIRGIKDDHSSTTTSSFHGRFADKENRQEFLAYLNSGTSLMNT